MHQLDSDCRRGFDVALPESKVIALPLKQEAPECVSDRTILAKLGSLAFSISVSLRKAVSIGVSDSQALAISRASALVRLVKCNGVASKEVEVENHVNAIDKLPNDCTVDGEENLTELSSDRQLEQFISHLLKYGVFLASAIVLVGGILYLIRYGAEPANYQFFRGESSVFSSPKDVMTAVLSGQCYGIIQLGLLILVATPIARVAFSLLAFLRQRDFTYVMLTLFVLSGLIYSLVGAYV